MQTIGSQHLLATSNNAEILDLHFVFKVRMKPEKGVLVNWSNGSLVSVDCFSQADVREKESWRRGSIKRERGKGKVFKKCR